MASPSLQAPVLPHPLSPDVRPFRPTACSKEDRWSVSSPPSVGLVPDRSFRDVVLSMGSSTAERQWSPSPAKPPPHIVLRSMVHLPSRSIGRIRRDGKRLNLVPLEDEEFTPRSRVVPCQLICGGKCFNCFSATHLAAVCSFPPCCFHCRVLGHRSYSCPNRGNGTSGPDRQWQATGNGASAPANIIRCNLRRLVGMTRVVALSGGGSPRCLNRRRQRLLRRFLGTQ